MQDKEVNTIVFPLFKHLTLFVKLHLPPIRLLRYPVHPRTPFIHLPFIPQPSLSPNPGCRPAPFIPQPRSFPDPVHPQIPFIPHTRTSHPSLFKATPSSLRCQKSVSPHLAGIASTLEIFPTRRPPLHSGAESPATRLRRVFPPALPLLALDRLIQRR